MASQQRWVRAVDGSPVDISTASGLIQERLKVAEDYLREVDKDVEQAEHLLETLQNTRDSAIKSAESWEKMLQAAKQLEEDLKGLMKIPGLVPDEDIDYSAIEDPVFETITGPIPNEVEVDEGVKQYVKVPPPATSISIQHIPAARKGGEKMVDRCMRATCPARGGFHEHPNG